MSSNNTCWKGDAMCCVYAACIQHFIALNRKWYECACRHSHSNYNIQIFNGICNIIASTSLVKKRLHNDGDTFARNEIYRIGTSKYVAAQLEIDLIEHRNYFLEWNSFFCRQLHDSRKLYERNQQYQSVIIRIDTNRNLTNTHDSNNIYWKH